MMCRIHAGCVGMLLALGFAGCQQSPPSQDVASLVTAPTVSTLAASKTLSNQPGDDTSLVRGTALVGKPAPQFELADLDGKKVRLTDFQGKVVVLEWFNPQCPFVKAAHTKGSLVNTAAKLQRQGVVYLAINSGAPGKQGHGAETNRTGAQTFNLDHPILLDETGAVGKAYGATNTPHLFVIDKAGKLAYRGAVDNSPDGEGESPEGGKLVSYLEQAVTSVLAEQPVATPETKAYGCSVKYGS